MTTSESVSVLRVSLSSRPVGYLVGYQGGRNVMVFDESFRGDPDRPTLTLSSHPTSPRATSVLGSPWPAIRVALNDTLAKARERWPDMLEESPMLTEQKARLRHHWRKLLPEFRIG
ncbi:hypothetical protein [Salinicola halophyticus]|uniref:hypothetical protein n=1 Tax=Salinicola halophyticus TaxID=1808881 RepID=UPI003F473E19